MLGTGSPLGLTPDRPSPDPWDLTLVLALLAALLITRFVLLYPLRPPAIALALVAGLVWAATADAVGFSAPTLGALVLTAALARRPGAGTSRG